MGLERPHGEAFLLQPADPCGLAPIPGRVLNPLRRDQRTLQKAAEAHGELRQVSTRPSMKSMWDRKSLHKADVYCDCFNHILITLCPLWVSTLVLLSSFSIPS